MSETVRIVIVVDGGLIQGIYTDGIPVKAVVVDYDIDGADPNNLITLDDDGPAYVTPHSVDDDPESREFVAKAFEAVLR